MTESHKSRQARTAPNTLVALVCPEHGTPRWAPRYDHHEQIRRCDTVGCGRPLERVEVVPAADVARYREALSTVSFHHDISAGALDYLEASLAPHEAGPDAA